MTRCLLLIEDDLAVQRVLTLALGQEGFSLRVTASGLDALSMVRDPDIEVVLLDLMLPDLDGLDVCRRIRRVSDVPLIMVTARSDSHDVVAGLEAGADDYIVKPFVAKVLAARVRALLRRADSEASPGGSLARPPRGSAGGQAYGGRRAARRRAGAVDPALIKDR